MIKTLLVSLISIVLSSCANFASNKRACEEAPIHLFYPTEFVGNIFQLSPCTSIEALRIETGDELSFIRQDVVSELKTGEGQEALWMFASRMGCRKTGIEHLIARMRLEKNEIFGEEFDASDRSIVIKIRKLTINDEILKKSCWE